MQVNSINSISNQTAKNATEPELVSLNQRMAETQQVAATSEPYNGESTTFDSIMEWITAGREQFLSDPKYMSEQLNAMIKKMVDKDGNKAVKGFSDVLEQMIEIKKAVDKAGYDELEPFFYDEVHKLMGINFFMQDFLNQALYPTVENGGKLAAYDY